MNTIFNPALIQQQAVRFDELAVAQLPMILRRLSALAVPISLTWGADRPLKFCGKITHILQKTDELRLIKKPEEFVDISLSALSELFISSEQHSHKLVIIGHNQKGVCDLSIYCNSASNLDQLWWEKLILACSQSPECSYSC